MTTTVQTDWPPLTLQDWLETQNGLHLRTQIVGKTRLALAPMQNHWWNTTLYVTARGLGTSPMPYESRTLEVDFDFIDHVLIARTADGEIRTLPLRAEPMATFYADYLAMLRSLDMELELWSTPVEIANPIKFTNDHRQLSYDPGAVQRYFNVLVQVDRVFKEFRGGFVGKSSPSHFWWGSFDIACTRFSGRRAPMHPGGIPNLADFVTREAYSHECISVGWWPGTIGSAVSEPAFYAYAYPEPDGYSEALVCPAAAHYNLALREWILPYAALLSTDNPDQLVQEFLQSTYDSAARLGSWSSDLVHPRWD
jgi:hypothetical protein